MDQENKVTKKITKKKRKMLKLLHRQRNPQKAIVSPQKYLEEIRFFHLYGDICIYDHIPSFERGEGILSVFNSFCNVREVSIDKDRSVLTVGLEKFKYSSNNWRLLVARLRSISNADAKQLADSVESLSRRMEEGKQELKKLSLASKPCKKRQEAELKSEIKNEGSTMEEETTDPGLEESEEELTEEEEEEIFFRELMEFVKTQKIKYLLNWVFETRSAPRGEINLKSMMVNRRLAELLGYSFENLSFLISRSGIPEIINPSDYFNFMNFIPAFRQFQTIKYDSINIYLLHVSGRSIPAKIKSDFIFTKKFKSREFIATLIEFEVDSVVAESFLKRQEAKEHLRSSLLSQECLSYKLLYEEFYEHFYPGTSLVPENMKLAQQGKICGFRKLN